jgi:DNA-binding HxlR family transcriptional regulator
MLAEAARKGNVMAADCPSRLILQHVTSRWGALVLMTLADGTLRFSEVRRRVDGVSERMLAQTLQVLESDHLVLRHAHDVVPPHVDYTLTPLGREIAARVMTLAGWIEDNLPALIAGQQA